MLRSANGTILMQEHEYCKLHHERHWQEWLNAPVGDRDESFEVFQWNEYEAYIKRNTD